MGLLLAVEGAPSELIVKRCLSLVNPGIEISGVLAKKGVTHLHSRRNELNTSAQHMQIVLLVDLDNPAHCPPQLRAEWFPHGLSAGLIFRVAVVEVEAWLLASRSTMAKYLQVRTALIPTDVETIADPKQHLINLARRSPNREIKSDIAPVIGSTAKIGRNYNGRLGDFISNKWDIDEAKTHSASLIKLVDSLTALA